jgi:hypothetical protein
MNLQLRDARLLLGALLSVCSAAHAALPASKVSPGNSDPGMPFVYTKWEQLTAKDGLPNDHIFAVKADRGRNCVWIGTEDGLACFDKSTRQIKSWREKDGLPWRVVTAI